MDTSKNTITEGALVWSYLYQVLHKYIERNPAIIPIKYEQLCVDPISTYKNLYRQLEIPWDKSVEHKVAISTSMDDQSRSLDRFSLRQGAFKSVKRNSKSVVESWKNVLNDNEVDTIREITEPIASKFYGHNEW